MSSFVAKSQPLICTSTRKFLAKHQLTSNVGKGKATLEELVNIVNNRNDIGYFKCDAADAGEEVMDDDDDSRYDDDDDDDDDDNEEDGRSAKGIKSLRDISPKDKFVVLLPFLLYYTASEQHKPIAFLLGFILVFTHFHRILLQGVPSPGQNLDHSQPQGKILVNIVVDLKKLMKFVHIQRKATNPDISLIHVVAKAVVNTVALFPALNGRIAGGRFYASETNAVELSVSVDSTEALALKVIKADSKRLRVIADELQSKNRTLRRDMLTEKAKSRASGHKVTSSSGNTRASAAVLLDALPEYISDPLKYSLRFCATYYGMSFPDVGILPSPYGTVYVTSAPRTRPDENHQSDERERESSSTQRAAALIPDCFGISSPVVVVGIDGITPRIDLDGEKKLVTGSTQMLNLIVAVDSRVASYIEAKIFAEAVKQSLELANENIF